MNTFDDRITPEDVHFMRTWGIYSEPDPLRVVTYNNRPIAVYKRTERKSWRFAFLLTGVIWLLAVALIAGAM